MARIPLLASRDGLSPAQTQVFDSIASGARGGVRGPHQVLLHRPAIASPVERLGAFLRYECRVPERQRELVILVVAEFWKADYEWFAHAPLAARQGHGADVLTAVGLGREPDLPDPADSAAWRVARELLDTRRITPASYAAAEAILGQEGMVDLVTLIGYYSLIAMTLDAFEVAVPEGAEIPWH